MASHSVVDVRFCPSHFVVGVRFSASEIVVCSCFILRFSSVQKNDDFCSRFWPFFPLARCENSLQNGFLKVYYKMQKNAVFVASWIENVRIRVTTKWVKKN